MPPEGASIPPLSPEEGTEEDVLDLNEDGDLDTTMSVHDTQMRLSKGAAGKRQATQRKPSTPLNKHPKKSVRGAKRTPGKGAAAKAAATKASNPKAVKAIDDWLGRTGKGETGAPSAALLEELHHMRAQAKKKDEE
ncbi:hypothetical protein KIPB_011957, partial [Kipferlia bialata]|eukprot:g11957.t1